MNRTPRSPWLPSLSTFIWLAFFLALCLSEWRLVLISADGDPCLHWRIGNWMIENQAVIKEEVFSHTRYGAPLISKEWGSEILFAAAGNMLGWNGAVLLAAMLIATVLSMIHRWLIAEGCDLLLATLLVLLAAWSMSHHWLARPHLLTHLFTVIYLWKLRAFERGQLSTTGLFLWLVPAMLVWVNFHGAFFTGFVLIGLVFLGNLTQPHRSIPLAIVGLACLLISLVNPNHWDLHLHILKFVREPLLAGYANEFRSPDFHSDGMTGFLALLLVVALMFLVARPKLRPSEILLLGAWGYFSLHSVRNIPIFTIVAMPVLAERWSTWLQGRREEIGRTRWHRISGRLVERQQTMSGLALWCVMVIAMISVMARTDWIRTELLRDRFPVDAVAFLQSNPQIVDGEMFNAYGWGGYLMWAMPEQKVFVDGRNDFYEAPMMTEFDAIDDVTPDWETTMDKYHVGWSILPVTHRLNAILQLHPAWRQLYRDDVAVIFGRDMRPSNHHQMP